MCAKWITVLAEFSVLIVFPATWSISVYVCPVLAILFLEFSVCMLRSVLMHHITRVSMFSDLRFIITS